MTYTCIKCRSVHSEGNMVAYCASCFYALSQKILHLENKIAYIEPRYEMSRSDRERELELELAAAIDRGEKEEGWKEEALAKLAALEAEAKEKKP